MHKECNCQNCWAHGGRETQIAKFLVSISASISFCLAGSTFICCSLKQKKKEQKRNKGVWPLLKPLSIKLNVSVCADTYSPFPVCYQFQWSTDHFDANATALHWKWKRSDCSEVKGQTARKLLVNGALLACCDHAHANIRDTVPKYTESANKFKSKSINIILIYWSPSSDSALLCSVTIPFKQVKTKLIF